MKRGIGFLWIALLVVVSSLDATAQEAPPPIQDDGLQDALAAETPPRPVIQIQKVRLGGTLFGDAVPVARAPVVRKQIVVDAGDVRLNGLHFDDALFAPEADPRAAAAPERAGAFVARPAAEMPEGYRLDGNYPNPFNPATTLRFEIPEPGAVELAVYDMLGRLVRVLADGVYEAGSHQATFDAGGLPSGVYLAHLTTPAGTLTHIMVLAK